MLKKYIGTKSFYKNVLALTMPIMIQNGITNFVNMLDNVMIGRVGTVEMTGVAVTNQLIFVFNLCIFGAISGAGIFGAQYFGSRDHEGVRHTFRFKMLFCTLLVVLATAIFLLWGDGLIGLYLRGKGDSGEIARSLDCAGSYLRIMLIGFLPYTLAQCYSSTLRETDHAVLPMVAGVIAVGVNLFLNYVLIFGHFGAPQLGVEGAAIATVISRFAELGIVAVWTHMHSAVNPFIVGAFRSLYIPLRLIRQIFLKGLPLMINETMWAAGMATLNQRYSVLSYDVVSANNICQTFSNVFSVVFISVGVAIGILLGQMLGAEKNDEARDASRKLIAFSVAVSVLVGAVYALIAGWIPSFYKTTDEVRDMAAALMRIYALAMPIDAFANAAYFTLRSGGKVMVTLLFDSVFVWVICVPTAFLLTAFTGITILPLFTVCQLINLLKCVLGYWLVKKGIWVRNIVV